MRVRDKLTGKKVRAVRSLRICPDLLHALLQGSGFLLEHFEHLTQCVENHDNDDCSNDKIDHFHSLLSLILRFAGPGCPAGGAGTGSSV